MAVSFTVPGSDAFPADMFHLRRGLVGGTLARAWLAWTDTVAGLRVLDIEHEGSSANPITFVAALAAAIRTPVVLGAGTQTPAQVAASIVAALVLAGVDASADGATVLIGGATDLVIPTAVDMTDTSLRGMWGMQRDDWGDGAAGQTLNQDGGTDAVVWMHLGTLTAAGRISGAYAWCNTGGAQCVMRLVVGTGPAYSLSPGAITVIGQGTATSDATTGFAGVSFEAVEVGAGTQIWVGHATDTATAGLRYRAQNATPLGAGDIPAAQNILVDLTRDPSSTNAFEASVTPTVDQNFAINSALGVVFELPDGSGRYPADGSLTALIGDHNPDPDHGTQFLAGPGILAGETTHHRQSVLPWTTVDATRVARVTGDTAAGEDSRAVFYEWADLLRPSTTPATRIADLGPMGYTAGTGNRRFEITLGTPVPVGSDVLTGPYWSLGFNYCTDDGDPIATLTLPVFLDDVAGDSGWLDCWEDDRETWHDDIRGASEYAQPAGVTEYRTRVSAGNNGMPTTDVDVAFPVTFATDPSDDSPSAIAIDYVIVARVGFVEVAIPTYPLAGDATVDGEWSMAAEAVYPLAGDTSADGAWSMDAGVVYTLAGEASADGAWSMAASAVYALAGDATADGAWACSAIAVPDIDDIVGGAGSELRLSVMGVDQYGVLRPRVGDPRPVRFEVLDASGAAIDHDIIESIEVQIRRASSSPSTAVTLEPTAEEESDSDDTVYTWAIDISETITVGGVWILEVEVVLVDGTAATWPSAGPLRIRAVENAE